MSTPKKTSKGPKPNRTNEFNRVKKNGEAQFERIQTILNQEHSGRQSRREFTKEEAQFINAVSGHERDERVQSTSRARLEKRRRNENNNSPTHTDYSTNSESEERKPEIPAYRQNLVKDRGPMTNSNIFKVTQKTLKNRSHERNLETKKRHPKRAKTQSAPQEPGVFKKLQNWVRKTVKSFQN